MPSRPTEQGRPGRTAPPLLLARFALTEHQRRQVARYGDLLAREPNAPTAIHDPERIVGDHFADALVAVEAGLIPSEGVLADLGSGAGVPALPIAIACPALKVYCVESRTNKCDFIQASCSALGLDNVEVVWARAESWDRGVGLCDVVTARALAALDVVLEYAAPLLKLGGRLVAWRGRRDADGELAAARAAAILRLTPFAVVPVKPYPGVESRHLHVFEKRGETPAEFPRREGAARKHPLGSRAAGTTERVGTPGPADLAAPDRETR
jgi:16S rRNA (guanine527-N7)-methyltransferase